MPPTLMRSSSRYFPKGTGCLTPSDGSGGAATSQRRMGGIRPRLSDDNDRILQGQRGLQAMVQRRQPPCRQSKVTTDPKEIAFGGRRDVRRESLCSRGSPVSADTIVHAICV